MLSFEDDTPIAPTLGLQLLHSTPSGRTWPERQAPGVFGQAAIKATRDERTENLQGAAAKVWDAWRQIDPAELVEA